MAKLDGSCLCGSATYSCEADPIFTAVCHCTHCQKQTGTAFSVVVGVPRDAFKLEGDTVSSYETVADSGSHGRREFCSRCGSPLATLSDGLPQVAIIKAGTLDDRSWLEPPSIQVFCDSAEPWVPRDALGGQQFARGPQ